MMVRLCGHIVGFETIFDRERGTWFALVASLFKNGFAGADQIIALKMELKMSLASEFYPVVFCVGFF